MWIFDKKKHVNLGTASPTFCLVDEEKYHIKFTDTN
jgi:hypothetical protein